LVEGFELRASCLLGGHSTTWATPPALFCFSCFSHRISYFCLCSLDCYLLTHDLQCSWDHRPLPPCLACWLWWGLLTFCLGWLQTSILQISISQAAGMTGTSHCTWHKLFLMERYRAEFQPVQFQFTFFTYWVSMLRFNLKKWFCGFKSLITTHYDLHLLFYGNEWI
jgi:hypothetical protein